MADAMETLKGILGDEDKLKSVVSSLSGASGEETTAIDGDYVAQMKDLVGKLSTSRNDPRTNLLMSLRPYMRSGRQTSIDNAVKMLNFVRMASLSK